MELLEKENLYYTNVMEDDDDEEEGSAGESSMAGHAQNFGATFLASKFAANTKKGAIKKVAIKLPDADSLKMPKMFKPTEPDFSTFHD